jgi:hypothetical protein
MLTVIKLELCIKYPVKVPPATDHEPPGRRVEVQLCSFLNLNTRSGRLSTPCPSRFTPGRDPVPAVQRLGGPHGQSGQVWKISPPPGFNPQNTEIIFDN